MPILPSIRVAAVLSILWVGLCDQARAASLDDVMALATLEEAIPAQLGPGAEHDERLQLAAVALAEANLAGGQREQGRGFTQTRQQLWEQGVADAVFASARVAFDGAVSAETVLGAVRDIGVLSRFDRYGVGVARDDTSAGLVVVLLSRRDADLQEPGTWAREGNREIRLWLRKGLEGVRVERIGPAGSVEAVRTTALSDQVHVMTIAGDRTPGLHRLEVRARQLGKEVLVAIHAADAPGEVNTPDDPAAFVLAMIHAERDRYDLPPLETLEALTRIAATHSEAMRDGMSFGHESPDTPAERIAAAGVPASVSLENVSRARSLAEAVTLFMASPGHRANVLDPRITHVGVGVARSEPLAWYVTADFVRWLPPRDVSEVEAETREIIEGTRDHPLRSKRALDEIAQRWCAEVAHHGADHLTQAQVRELTDEVHFHLKDAQRVMADLAIVEESHQVGLLPELRQDEFDQYGLGLVQDDGGGMIRLLVILVDRKAQ